MMTRLLLFILLIFSFGNAQINVNEGFESGLPAGWINSNYSVTTATSCSGSQSLSASLFTSGSNGNLQTTSYISNGNAITFSYSYKAQFYSTDNFIARLYYEVNNTNTWTQVNTNTIFSASCQTLSATLAAGVVPAGTPIRFRAQINRMTGGGVVYIDDFVATQSAVTALSVSSITSTSAIINYNLNANNAATTSIIRYGIVASALNFQVAGHSAAGGTNVSGSTPITGLLPNTQYFCSIEATNASGSTQSSIVSFTTSAAPMSLITEYDFNNTYNNVNGNTPFNSNTGTSFDTGRDGVTTNGAININNTGSTATILNLPYGNASRTVSLWVKTNTMNSGYNMVFSYGQGANSSAFGSSYNATVCELFGFANNLSIASSNTNNTWYHFVYSYDGSNAKIYKNGALLTTVAKSWNTLNSSNIFKLGIGVGNEISFRGAIDDLKIYNYAVTDADVTSLYTNNTLSSSDFSQNNIEVALYPNPVNDVLNIDTKDEISSVEVFALQGQKVLSSKENKINVSQLPAGIYLVRIEDVNNNIATKKIIKN